MTSTTDKLTVEDLDEIESRIAWRIESDSYSVRVTGPELARLIAAARRGIEAQWRPIETAPKDGTPILAFFPERDRPGGRPSARIAVVCWRTEGAGDTNTGNRRVRVRSNMVKKYGGYWGPPGPKARPNIPPPTKWMPLPAPPPQAGEQDNSNVVPEGEPTPGVKCEPSGAPQEAQADTTAVFDNGLQPQTSLTEEAAELVRKKQPLCNQWDETTRHNENMSYDSQNAGDDLCRWSHEAAALIRKQAALIAKAEAESREDRRSPPYGGRATEAADGCMAGLGSLPSGTATLIERLTNSAEVEGDTSPGYGEMLTAAAALIREQAEEIATWQRVAEVCDARACGAEALMDHNSKAAHESEAALEQAQGEIAYLKAEIDKIASVALSTEEGK